jgi:predicted transcriptional regulator
VEDRKLLLSELRAEINKGLADREAGRVADSIPKNIRDAKRRLGTRNSRASSSGSPRIGA